MKAYRFIFLFLGFFTALFISMPHLNAEQAAPEKKTKASLSKADVDSFNHEFKEAQSLAKEEKWFDAQKKARALINSVPSDSARLELFRFLRQVRFELLFSKKITEL